MTFCNSYHICSDNDIFTEFINNNTYSPYPYICLLLILNNKDWYLILSLIYIWHISINNE